MDPEYIIEGRTLRQADIDSHVRMLAARLAEQTDIAVHARDRLTFLVTLLACRQKRCRLLAAPSYWSAQRFADWLARSRAAAFVRRGSQSHLELMRLRDQGSPAAPGIVIYTSGSTGKPKGVEHSWENAAASSGFTSERISEKNWYLTYEPAGYAGLQVIYAAAASAGRLVMPPYGTGFSEHARLITKHDVEVVSATPTWWRMLISSWPSGLRVPRLLQATLGGEIVDQGTLDQVVKFFEPQHLTHIYASSEAGTALAISDRRAGFPSRYLRDPKRKVALRVRDRVLEVSSPFRMRGYLDGDRPQDEWIRTGDLIEEQDDRCYFVGREDSQLNIGGLKVRPEEVEAALCDLPEVHDCVAYGRANPIVGTLLAADIIPESNAQIDAGAVRERLRPVLPEHKIPRHIRIVDQLPVSPNGKKQRH
jgi:acyl-coenzyme A synthetase/AMP-(fatty) acid ligase